MASAQVAARPTVRDSLSGTVRRPPSSVTTSSLGSRRACRPGPPAPGTGRVGAPAGPRPPRPAPRPRPGGGGPGGGPGRAPLGPRPEPVGGPPPARPPHEQVEDDQEGDLDQ